MSTSLGRLLASEKGGKILHDLPEKQAKAMMSQLDDIVAQVQALVVAVKAIAAKLDADGGVTDTNYASTITASVDKSLANLDLFE
jgi:hypothetical protein